jgi:sugar phosphate isomerase/epimerase
MTDNLGMAFDTGNFLFAGEDAYRAVLHFGDKVSMFTSRTAPEPRI